MCLTMAAGCPRKEETTRLDCPDIMYHSSGVTFTTKILNYGFTLLGKSDFFVFDSPTDRSVPLEIYTYGQPGRRGPQARQPPPPWVGGVPSIAWGWARVAYDWTQTNHKRGAIAYAARKASHAGGGIAHKIAHLCHGAHASRGGGAVSSLYCERWDRGPKKSALRFARPESLAPQRFPALFQASSPKVAHYGCRTEGTPSRRCRRSGRAPDASPVWCWNFPPVWCWNGLNLEN